MKEVRYKISIIIIIVSVIVLALVYANKAYNSLSKKEDSLTQEKILDETLKEILQNPNTEIIEIKTENIDLEQIEKELKSIDLKQIENLNLENTNN